MDDETLSSKEDLISKARKPYTITKQRERWTAEEHNRFLEAIKLYGRAWQRIEEHIGTKTAVQIRSHAQKFFSKLEKEALNKGVPLGQARDIDIPPPRPKRKPSNPYPRKTSSGIPNSIHMGMKDGNPLKSASSSPSSIQMQDPENNLHLEKPCKKAKGKENVDEDNSSGILSLSRETPCTSFSTSTKTPSISLSLKNKCVFKDYIPSVKERSNAGATDESFLNAGAEGNQKLDRTDANCTDMDDGTSGNPNLNSCCHNLDGQVIKEEELKQPENLCLLPKEDIQSNQNYPRHIPVHVLESSSETCSQSLSHYMTHQTSFIHQVEGTFRNVNNFTNPAASENYSNISIQPSVQNFPSPLNPGSSNHDSYNMFVNPTFHNLILSTLLQNPAAHAAASFVASLWPFTNVETSVDSPPCTIEGSQLRHGGPSPSASAIAAATVMAASAWWAANGLLPLCPPVHAGYTCIPAPTNSSPTDSTLVLVEKDKKNHRLEASTWEGQQLDPGLSKPAEPKLSNCKSLLLSPADFNENESVMSKSDAVGHEQKPVSITGFHESEKGKAKEQVDRSSCGSNTPSGSEVEMDMLEKLANGKDESKEHNVNQRTSEPNNNRNRSMAIVAESWREVSEEGKIAFKALFSREVLPQSFSPPKCLGNNGQLMKSDEEGLHKSYKEKDDDKLQLDLNSKTPLTCPDCGENEKGELPPSGGQIEEGLLLMGCGHGKLKARRTGFKPYKRCSVEAGKESRVMSENNQGEERDAKRVCLEGEASI